LVLTKTDLAAPAAVAALERRLRRLNPGAPLHRAVQGGIGPEILLAAGPYDPAAKAPEVAAWLDAEAWAAAEAARHHRHHHHHHAHDANRHDARVHAFCLVFDDPLPLEGLATWLEMLVATRGEALLRVKGLLNLVGEDVPIVLHAVQHVFHPPARLAAWPPGHDRRSRLVFILRDLPRQAVEQGLNAFLDAAAPR
jgi:G3E family GTPase